MIQEASLCSSVARNCNECESKGKDSKLVFSMVSYDTGIWLCSGEMCNFPLNSQELEKYVETLKSVQKTVLDVAKSQSKSSAKREQHLKHRRTKSVVSPSFISKKTTSSSTSSSEGKRSQKDFLQNGPVYPLWRNERTNLCWLDATLSLLVTNKNINTVFDAAPEDSVIKVFLAQYNKCMEIFNKDKDYANVQETLASIRQDVWNFLQPKLTLTAGQFDSPLFTLPLLLKEDARLREMTILKYSHSFQCEHCGFEKQTKTQTHVLSIPNCTANMNIPETLGFTRHCFKCEKEDQLSSISFEDLPEMIIIHCLDGFKKSKFWRDYHPWKDQKRKDEYYVSHIIQYTGNHYILWTCDPKSKTWLKADDLQDPVCRFSCKEPNIPMQESSIVVWEKIKPPAPDVIERDKTAVMMDSLTLCSGSSSSSSSVSNRLELDKVLDTSTQPIMMKNWLKEIKTEPPVNSLIQETSCEHVKEQSDAVKRYTPYVIKRNQRTQHHDMIQGVIELDSNKTTIKDPCSNLQERSECHVPNSNQNIELNLQNILASESVLCPKDSLYDSAYSSPISDQTTDMTNTQAATSVCTFDDAMEMIDNLFEPTTTAEVTTPMCHAYGQIPKYEDTENIFDNEIDISMLL